MTGCKRCHPDDVALANRRHSAGEPRHGCIAALTPRRLGWAAGGRAAAASACLRGRRQWRLDAPTDRPAAAQKRPAGGAPATTAAAPFPLVDNESSLLDTTDLVFVNAVGTGLSEAIAPFTNQSFWGVDKDAAVFRDFVVRYIAANNRQASPKFLFGESYGGPRTAVLAHLLESAGVALTGLVLQSPALDYNSNCAIPAGSISCARYPPSYAAGGVPFSLGG